MTLAAQKDKFYDSLSRILDIISSQKEIFLIGDLNARIGFRLNDLAVGCDGKHAVNADRIIELCHQHALKINGLFQT